MVIVAHPGDEAFGFGGAIAGAAAEGAYVVVVCVTRGWFDPRLADKPRRTRRQEPRPQARPGQLAQPRHRPRGRAAPERGRPRRPRRPHARLRRGRARPRGLRPPRRPDRRADSDASAGGDPQLRSRRDHRRHRPRRPLARRASGLPARRRAARVRERHRGGPGRLARRQALRPRRAPVRGVRPRVARPGRGVRIRCGADAGARARRSHAAEAGGDQPPRVADGVRRPVPRLGRRGPRRVPLDRVLPPRRQRRRPSRRAAASASTASSTGSARRSSQRALLRSVGRIGPAWR